LGLPIARFNVDGRLVSPTEYNKAILPPRIATRKTDDRTRMMNGLRRREQTFKM
jgi:hypothetical protein